MCAREDSRGLPCFLRVFLGTSAHHTLKHAHAHVHTHLPCLLPCCCFSLPTHKKKFGQNACGELGLGDAVERPTPTLSQSSRVKGVVHVTAGNELTAVLTNTGEVGASVVAAVMLLLATLSRRCTCSGIYIALSLPLPPPLSLSSSRSLSFPCAETISGPPGI